MTHHDHSKVEVSPTGNITLAVDRNGNPMKGVALNWLQSLTDCPAYSRYIDRRVSHPAEDPRASARWANDWPASATSMPGCLYIVGKDGQRHKAGTPEAIAAMPKLPTVDLRPGIMTTGTGAITLGEGGVGRPWTVKEVQRVESAQDEYPPVYDRPTFFLCVLIAALAGMLVGLIAGAMVMA